MFPIKEIHFDLCVEESLNSDADPLLFLPLLAMYDPHSGLLSWPLGLLQLDL